MDALLDHALDLVTLLALCGLCGFLSCGIGWYHGRRHERELRTKARHI